MSLILYSLILIKKIDCQFALEPIQTLFSVAEKKHFHLHFVQSVGIYYCNQL